MKKQELFSLEKDSFNYITVALVAILMALNYQLFIVENHFAPAGLNGIATMIQYKTGFGIGYMSLIINIPLCVFAFFTLSRTFAARSLVFCLVYSFSLIVLQKTGLDEFQYISSQHNMIFPVILSGVISGFVYGICLRITTSTGGTDIAAKYVSLKKPELNFFWINFTINTEIAIISFFVYAQELPDGSISYNYDPVCLCIMYCFISSFVGNWIIKGTKSACKFTVITTHPEEISNDVSGVLRHGVTRLSAFGSYTHTERAVLICVVNRHQISDFISIIKKYNNTFAFLEPVGETYGNFKHIK